MIRLAQPEDIDAVEDIYNLIHDEEENGNMQIGWLRNVYPVRNTALDALKRRDLFVEEVSGNIVASAIINQLQVPEYADCKWENQVPDENIMVLHTLTVSPKIKGNGYGKAFVEFYENYARKHGCSYLRMDTQSKNIFARKFYNKLGYSEPGVVYCVFNGIPNVELVCLEKKLP
ncbi:MAG: GNAT family N-acetyltransferase [Lachnospiraceae bacterium]|nr:GNAT family N-acetyltransferase [Lachnospiraceae bacterium]